ncbi:MAG TPA: ATP-binding protein [Candidatus Acidoferrum sp.]|nr:ATP-binding protein [Candidatus Acidoferrum sp.]
MPFVSNPGFLAVAFIEGSAAFIILVLYSLLVTSFPARFFRFWIAGWTTYVLWGALRMVSIWRGGPDFNFQFSAVLSLLAAVLFLAAIIECTGRGAKLRWLAPLASIGALAIYALHAIGKMPTEALWAERLSESGCYLLAGWLLWRTNARHQGVGWKLLAGALILRGLHGFDRAAWSGSEFGLFRMSFHGLFGIAMGIAMAVLVLEAGRARTEDLNEKLRRLAIITAEATQSLRVQETLEGVVRHLVESLGASHGVVYLFDGAGESRSLAVRATVGFSEDFLSRYTRISPRVLWAQTVVEQQTPFVVFDANTDSGVRDWMREEKLSTLVLVRIPGKESPLGFLGIGSATPRAFASDEENFLVNVANLLGLTVQNVSLFEVAANSRRQWLDTFDSIGDLILVHSPEGAVLRANRTLAWHLGVEPGELEGQLLHNLLQQADVRWTNCPYCEGAAGKPEQIDPTFGGYFLVTNSTFHDSNGVPLGTIHVLKDFTERRQAENKFRMLFENVQEGIFISTPEGRFLDFNNALMSILGYEKREELLSVDIPSTFYPHAEDREHLKRLLREHGAVSDFEFRFRRRDGEIRIAHESSFVTRDDSGAIVAYQGFLLDVTDRKHAEMEIRRRNRELLALNSIGGMLSQSSDIDEILNRVLPKVAELFKVETCSIYFLDEPPRTLKRIAAVGYETDFARTLPPVEISSAVLDQVKQARATLLSGSAIVVPEALRELQRREKIQESQIAVLWSKDRIMGVLVIGCRSPREFSPVELNLLAAVGNQIATTIDKALLLKETQDAYQSLALAQEQLLQSEKMAAVGQLISGVAHELNNPLTAILGYSQLLQAEEPANSRGADYIEKLYKQAQRTHHIVQSLLSFARQHKPERKSVDLNQILEDTLILREYDMKLNSIRIHREFQPDLPVTAGDFHQLQQVFLNILNNAVDALVEKGGKGEIWVRTALAGNRLRVEITDNGPGVKDPHRVFDPFYTTKPVGKGTGLGLSICYGIVKEHGGEIQVRNSPPRGATFAIVLPVLVTGEPSEREKVSPARAEATGTVLLVDHEEAVLQLEQEILRARGVTVRAARSAQEAIDVLRRQAVDAIVADMKIPGELSATGLYRWIEANRADLAGRIVFTVSNARDGEISAALRNSGCSILEKPFSIESFCGTVLKTLRAEIPSPAKP